MNQGEVFVFGEVLFDHFPDGSAVLGGAPFNVAWHLQAFGLNPLFISRVGDDAEGRRILQGMRQWGMREDGVQIDPAIPTGRVDISFAADGEPSYDIVHPCAYDAIAGGDLPAGACRLLYHGSLALRDERSRRALLQLKAGHTGLVFVDVNLRPPWWQPAEVLALLADADWVKLNADELAQLAHSADAASFLANHQLQGLVLTHGAAGAEIITPDADPVRIRPEHSMEVVDSVGAGDAFAAVVVLGLASGWPLALTAERAQAFASQLVRRRGATVDDVYFYHETVNSWKGVD